MAKLMTRVEKALTAGALAMMTVAPAAQTPDFSGRWTAVANAAPEATPSTPVPPAGFGSGVGPDVTITQTPATLKIERAQFSQYDMQPMMVFVYALDGSDSRNVVEMGRGAQETVSRASWQKDALVLHTTYRYQNPANAKPATSELRQVFTLEGPDTLVVTTVRGGSAGPEATSRQVYKKR
jgi:hypothetical protein